jgi:hypothetical protein
VQVPCRTERGRGTAKHPRDQQHENSCKATQAAAAATNRRCHSADRVTFSTLLGSISSLQRRPTFDELLDPARRATTTLKGSSNCEDNTLPKYVSAWLTGRSRLLLLYPPELAMDWEVAPAEGDSATFAYNCCPACKIQLNECLLDGLKPQSAPAALSVPLLTRQC